MVLKRNLIITKLQSIKEKEKKNTNELTNPIYDDKNDDDDASDKKPSIPF